MASTKERTIDADNGSQFPDGKASSKPLRGACNRLSAFFVDA
jgi:hypothetical protein